MTRDPIDSVSTVLHRLPARMAPPGLRTSLRVLASKERLRLLSRQINWRDRLNLSITNMMRPLALPLAGGIFSTVALFSICLGPMVPVRADDTSDIPTGLTTEAAVKSMMPLAGSCGEVVVDVIVDETGRMVDYKVVSGFNTLTSAEIRRSLENRLIFTTFEPVTQFGHAKSGKLRLYFRNSEVDVKG
jgi:hypothetical protein